MERWLIWLLPLVSLLGQAPPDLPTGKRIFESQCALCHAPAGTGGRGPSLTRPTLDRAPDDAALRKLISDGIDPEMPGAWQLHPREVESVALYVRSLGTIPPESVPGDPVHGRELYGSKGCAGCHIVAGEGNGFGPELSGIGARRNATFLRNTLLEPRGSLPEGFLYISVKPAGAQPMRGIRVNEDSFTIQLKDAQSRYHSFRKSELEELHRLSHESPMPSYRGVLTSAELDDMTAYLAGLKGKP